MVSRYETVGGEGVAVSTATFGSPLIVWLGPRSTASHPRRCDRRARQQRRHPAIDAAGSGQRPRRWWCCITTATIGSPWIARGRDFVDGVRMSTVFIRRSSDHPRDRNSARLVFPARGSASAATQARRPRCGPQLHATPAGTGSLQPPAVPPPLPPPPPPPAAEADAGPGRGQHLRATPADASATPPLAQAPPPLHLPPQQPRGTAAGPSSAAPEAGGGHRAAHRRDCKSCCRDGAAQRTRPRRPPHLPQPAEEKIPSPSAERVSITGRCRRVGCG